MRLRKPFLGEKVLVGLRAVGRIGLYDARRVGLVEQAVAQPRLFIRRGVAGFPAADQAALAIDQVCALP